MKPKQNKEFTHHFTLHSYKQNIVRKREIYHIFHAQNDNDLASILSLKMAVNNELKFFF